jgi:CelD/BcsL family acetyltransferase involved in cellulose biosynthesis
MFPDAWLWHRWEAIDAYATWPNTDDVSFALLDPATNQPVALVPMRRVARRWPNRRLTSRLESTGGPAYVPTLSPRQRGSAEREVRAALLDLARKEGAHRIELAMAPLAPARNGDAASHVNPLAMLGCTDTSTQSWILDLAGQSEDALWRNLEHRVRKTVNKAERGGVTVREVEPKDLADYLRLHQSASIRNGLPVKPAAYFETIFEAFLPQGLAAGLCAVAPDGQTIAMHIFAVYKDAALYWVVASDEEALTSGANDLVQWHAIKAFAAQGLARYECGEAFPGAPAGKRRRISDFKKGFGGALAPYYRGTLIPRPVTAAILDLLRSMRRDGERGDP